MPMLMVAVCQVGEKWSWLVAGRARSGEGPRCLTKRFFGREPRNFPLPSRSMPSCRFCWYTIPLPLPSLHNLENTATPDHSMEHQI